MPLLHKILSGMTNCVDLDQTAYVILSDILVFEILGHLFFSCIRIKGKASVESNYIVVEKEKQISIQYVIEDFNKLFKETERTWHIFKDQGNSL